MSYSKIIFYNLLILIDFFIDDEGCLMKNGFYFFRTPIRHPLVRAASVLAFAHLRQHQRTLPFESAMRAPSVPAG